jgi:hypothetical protein
MTKKYILEPILTFLCFGYQKIATKAFDISAYDILVTAISNLNSVILKKFKF